MFSVKIHLRYSLGEKNSNHPIVLFCIWESFVSPLSSQHHMEDLAFMLELKSQKITMFRHGTCCFNNILLFCVTTRESLYWCSWASCNAYSQSLLFVRNFLLFSCSSYMYSFQIL